MGSLLTTTPISEIIATLEVLDNLGLTREDLRNVRKADDVTKKSIIKIMRLGHESGTYCGSGMTVKAVLPSRLFNNYWRLLPSTWSHGLPEVDLDLELPNKVEVETKYGAEVLEALKADYDRNPKDSILEKLRMNKGIHRIIFQGDVYSNPNGYHAWLGLCYFTDDTWKHKDFGIPGANV